MIVDVSAAPLEPFSQAGTTICHHLELNRSASLLLDDGRAISNGRATYKISNPDLHDVATAQLTVDCEIQKGPIPQSSVFIEKETNGPDVARL